MNLIKEFALYVVDNNIPLTRQNFEQHLKDYKKQLTDSTTTMWMCDRELSLGDYVEVRYKTGGGISGTIIELCPYIPQVKVKSGWCFHDDDTITVYRSAELTPPLNN